MRCFPFEDPLLGSNSASRTLRGECQAKGEETKEREIEEEKPNRKSTAGDKRYERERRDQRRMKTKTKSKTK